MNSKEALIRQVFQNPATGLISAEKLYQKLKDRNVSRDTRFLTETGDVSIT